MRKRRESSVDSGIRSQVSTKSRRDSAISEFKNDIARLWNKKEATPQPQPPPTVISPTPRRGKSFPRFSSSVWLYPSARIGRRGKSSACRDRHDPPPPLIHPCPNRRKFAFRDTRESSILFRLSESRRILAIQDLQAETRSFIHSPTMRVTERVLQSLSIALPRAPSFRFRKGGSSNPRNCRLIATHCRRFRRVKEFSSGTSRLGRECEITKRLGNRGTSLRRA